MKSEIYITNFSGSKFTALFRHFLMAIFSSRGGVNGAGASSGGSPARSPNADKFVNLDTHRYVYVYVYVYVYAYVHVYVYVYVIDVTVLYASLSLSAI